MISVFPPLRNGYHLLFFEIQVLQCRNGKKSGILHDHLVIFHHIQECHYQFIVLYGDYPIHVLLQIRENAFTRRFYRRARPQWSGCVPWCELLRPQRPRRELAPAGSTWQ